MQGLPEIKNIGICSQKKNVPSQNFCAKFLLNFLFVRSKTLKESILREYRSIIHLK